MLTATAGFRHDSIATARQVVTTLGTASGFSVTATEDVTSISAATLANYDVLFFALTSGELAFTAEQRAAILSFVASGKGFLGAHSATDTLYEWPEYGALIGAYFKEHPWTRVASVIVEDRAHAATMGLGERFSIEEEFYTFRENPRGRVQVLLRLDAASVGAVGRLSAGLGAVARRRARVLQRPRALRLDLVRPAVSAADRGRDPVGGGPVIVEDSLQTADGSRR